MKDLPMMLLKEVFDALPDGDMLNHADDAGDVDVLWMADEVIIDRVGRCPRWVLRQAQCNRWSSHDDAVEDVP